VIHFLEAEAQGKNRTLDGAFFRRQLNDGCLLLLDGLDEAADQADQADRKAMARLLEYTARAYEKTQVVATSRPQTYGGETVIPGFATIQIQPLDEEAVAAFVGKWCHALYRDEEKAGEHQAELLGSIRSKPEIQDMAVNPVMLTAIAALHWNRTRLPDQRTELYDSILTWLAQAREEKRKESRIPAVQCLAHMEHLAYTMHGDRRGKQVEITRHAAARAGAPVPGDPGRGAGGGGGTVSGGGGNRQRDSGWPGQYAALLASHVSGVSRGQGSGLAGCGPAAAVVPGRQAVSAGVARNGAAAGGRVMQAGSGARGCAVEGDVRRVAGERQPGGTGALRWVGGAGFAGFEKLELPDCGRALPGEPGPRVADLRC
jgi:hypothetical protein